MGHNLHSEMNNISHVSAVTARGNARPSAGIPTSSDPIVTSMTNMASATLGISKAKEKGFSRSINLSALYGVFVVLLGFVIIASDAISEHAMSPHVVAVFMSYLYAVASVFIMYLQVHENILKRRYYREVDQKKEDDIDKYIEQAYHNARFNRNHVNLAITEQEEESDGENQEMTELQLLQQNSNSTSNNNSRTNSIASTSSSTPDTSSNHDSDEISKPRIRFAVAGNDSGFKPKMNNFGGGRRRFSVAPTSSTTEQAEQTPDDVYNYIANQQGTATMASEGTSFFMKGGSLIFAIANIVYTALRIEGAHNIHQQCGGEQIIYPHYLHLIFIILQTFFLLKDSVFVLRTYKTLVRFGLVHLVATNICVWVRFLLIEVVEALEHMHAKDSHGSHGEYDSHAAENGHHGAKDLHVDVHDDHHYDNHSVTPAYPNKSGCVNLIEPIMLKAGPYLFPFILEYSLVAMSTAAFMFSSINIRVSAAVYHAICKALKKKRDSECSLLAAMPKDEEVEEGTFSKSNVGLFAGAITLAGVVISMVLFMYLQGAHDLTQASMCYALSESVLMSCLLLATFIGTLKFCSMDVDLNLTNTLDHALLLVSVSFYVILELFKLVSTGNIMIRQGAEVINVLNVIVNMLSIAQSVSQTVFIVDGMQRKAATVRQKMNKPGRGVITYLIVCNVSAWVFKSFQEKHVDFDPQYQFFGDTCWTIISSISLPMILFYRFHSSICLAHMWNFCYKEHEEQLVESKILQ